GCEVLEVIGAGPAIVFGTAYDEHALRAFEVHAVDYVMKPFRAERFESALERAKQRVGGTLPFRPEELTASTRTPGQYAERVVLKDGTRVHIFPLSRLDYAKSQHYHVSLPS